MAEYIIAGDGVAGTTAAENIRKLDNKGRITIVTDEDLPFYYRIRLDDYISGDINQNKLIAKKESWYEQNNINLILNTKITGADPQKKMVITDKEERLCYDKLLVATGSHSFIPHINGSDKKGVFAIRDIRDARDIMEYAKGIHDVVVIGGGLLGLEAGNTFRKMNKNVTVVEFFPRILPRQLDVDGAERLKSIMEGMGLCFRLDARTEAIEGGDVVKAVKLAGGEILDAQMVIISAGVRPNLELAEPLGLECDKGIKVNDRLGTNRPDVYAAGDVAEFKGLVYGIWPAAMEQGKIAGANMAGKDMIYPGTTMANTLKVVGIDLASAGEIDAENKFESQTVSTENMYKKIVIDNNRIIGCIMLGETKTFGRVTKLMSSRSDISPVKDKILKGDF
ncbi:FAD-dependent oxidoreductase [uncultured Desulfobacter sp.]|uniref:NAD(P)/FAD-dependent oxidoreductase n=1 Tax=uncultured Desulfobacter sp. TaxID=240139 RepID=UPI002AAC4787|nr:FAD-dependent oxidoreductase [uncultured Desulfobacter sp.]